MKNIRWGILGTARIADEQLIPALKMTPGAELIAVASRNYEKGVAFGEKHNIPRIYDDYETLLQDVDVDAVYIPLPNHLHAEWTIKAARHGKHVLCEKPAALTAPQAEEMIQICEDNHVLFMEAFMYQFHPQWKRLKELIDNREIGDIQLINASFSFLLEAREDIRLHTDMGGGSLYDLGCYCTHSIGLIANSDWVQCFANATHRQGVDGSTTATMKFKNGIVAHFDCSFQVPYRQRVEVCGSEGSMVISYPFRADMGIPKLIVSGRNGVYEETFEDVNVYKLQLEHFQTCILEQSLPHVSKVQTINNMKMIDELYRSSRT